MRDQLLAAATDAVQEIAATMLFVEIAPGGTGEGGCGAAMDVSAIVGVSGTIQGSVRLAALEPAALRLASALAGSELTTLEGEAQDAFAELANMITGGIQSRLADTVGPMNLSPPVLVRGSNHQVCGKTDEVRIHRLFSMENTPFAVEIFFVERK